MVHQFPLSSFIAQPLKKIKPQSSKRKTLQSSSPYLSLIFRLLFVPVSSLRELSHTEIPPGGCAGISRHQASNSSSDHIYGQHISNTHVILLLSPINEGALCSPRVWFGFCVCTLVQIYTLLYVSINISCFSWWRLISTDFTLPLFAYKSEDSCIRGVLF